MKRVLLSVALLFCLPLANAGEASDQEVKQFFDVLNVKKNYEAGLDGMMDVQRKSVKDFYLFESTFKEWIDKYISWQVVEPDMINMYRSYFSSEDIKELTRFYQTPVGIKYITKSPFVAKESMRIGGEAAKNNRKYLQEMVKTKIEMLKQQGLYKGNE